MLQFCHLNLHPLILNSLEKKGYKTPTQIQEKAIPFLLEGIDLLGIAQTGTGKTAAFSLPIINNLAKNKIKVKPARMRALILTPTRELASQIFENIKTYGKEFNFHNALVFGGVGERPQIMAMSRGVEILVATPGRLLDLMDQGHIRFDQLEIFVLDEADRMLDMGFIHDVKKIISFLPPRRQTMLFSATMPQSISQLAGSILKNPERVEITPPSSTVDRIEQKINFVAKGNKPGLLKEILKDQGAKSVLVFSRTKHGANKIVAHLEKAQITSAAIHGNKSQGARERALENFKSGKIRVLVATDIASRGIDVPGVSHVINYDIPNEPEAYVHRIGRTARAGKDGIAISFCDETEVGLLRTIEKLIKIKLKVDDKHQYHMAFPNKSKPIFKGKNS